MTNTDPIRRIKELTTIFNVSRTVIHKLLKSGDLPKIQISERCIGVLQSDIDAYLQKQRIKKKPFE